MNRIALTKNDMARVIVAALYNMDALPPADHFRVVRIAKHPKAGLAEQHARALKVIENRNSKRQA